MWSLSSIIRNENILMVVVALAFAWVMTTSCAHSQIPFQLDLAYKSSGEAGSYEYPLLINNEVCKDMKGKPGSCVLNSKRNLPISLNFLPQLASFSLSIFCQNGISFKKDVEAGKQFTVTLGADKFVGLNELQCGGVIQRHDIPEPVTSQFRFWLLFIDADYQGREEIYWNGDKIILGRFAMYGNGLTFPTNEHIKTFQQTSLKWPRGAERVCLATESYKARWNIACLP